MSELSKYLVTFRAFDGSRSQNYCCSHSMEESLSIVNKDPNCKEILSIVIVEDSGPKVKKRSGFVSNCLSDDLNAQLTDQLHRLHKGN
jgi:hypothetical protein